MKLSTSVLVAASSAEVATNKFFTIGNSAPTDNGSNGWTMTEFNLENETDDYSRSFGLCVTGDAWGGVSSCDDTVNYMSFFNSICGTMTEGGDYIMADYKGNLFKLGSCGLEQIDAQLTGSTATYWTQSQFCGKIKGGAAFCSGFFCTKYSDETGKTTQVPQVDGWVWFDEGSVFTAGSDDTLVILGGTKSETYSHFPDLQNMTTKPEKVNFVGQYLDVDQNRWMPLDYHPDQLEDDKLNFPFRYQKTAYWDETYMALYRTNAVDYDESVDDIGLWRDGPTYLVSINDWEGVPAVISTKLPIDVTGGPSGSPYMNVFTGYGDNSTYYTEDASHYIGVRSNNFGYTVHAQNLFCGTESQPIGSLAQGIYDNRLPGSPDTLKQVNLVSETCGHGQNLIELEFYKHDYKSDNTFGPFYRWALGDNQSGLNVDLYGFFLDDLNMDPLKTCYLDMCENNPCADGQKCESTWDGTDAWYTCDGEPGTDDTDGEGDSSDGPITLDGSCYVNNGGCTHDCAMSTDNTYVCECPPCWSMSTDGQTCYPSSDSISTFCGPNEMVIRMNKCVLENSHDWTSARMIDGAECTFAEDENDSDYVILTNGLDECGMALTFENDTLTYSNTLQVSSSTIGGMIVTKPNVEWGFACTYDTEYTIGESLTVNAAAITQGFSQTNAQFAFSFDFYTDGSYAELNNETAAFQVGQYINFGVSMNGGEALSNLNFVASSCEVTNGDLTFTIFDMNNEDNCEASAPVFFQQHTSTTPAVSFYSYMGFSFMNEDEESSEQRVSCTLKVCHEDDLDSVCSSGCYNPNGFNSTSVNS